MRLPSFVLLAAAAALPSIAHAQTANLKLWYDKPASVWNQAVPISTGRIGAMVFGGANTGPNNGDQQDVRKNKDILDGSKTRAQDEHLQLNESTLWQGKRESLLNPRGHEGFTKVRALLLESKGTDAAKIAEAEKLAAQTLISNPSGMPSYSTLGDIYIRSASNEPVTNYRRSLDIETGIATVSYTSAGINYTREIFASNPAGVIVIRLAASKPRSLSFTVSMDRPQDFAVATQSNRDLLLTPGPNYKEQIQFQGQARVLTTAGKVKAVDNTLSVEAATGATILLTAATDYSGASPSKQCTTTLNAATSKPYKTLLAAASTDIQSLMRRMTFSLGAPNAEIEALPTDERLRRVSAGSVDLGLQSLYFQFARYLLIGSSRPGGMPSNLQGLWASGITNPWGSKYTINVNTEMNYWLAEPANLPELHLPLFDMLDRVRTPGKGWGTEVAKQYYNARGFVIHHNTDIWGDAHPIDGVPYGIWPMGGAWLTLHAWEHYAFSGDKTFLKNRAWPLLHDTTLFFLDYLVENGQGHLVTGPSLSPENQYRLPDGSKHSLTMAPTMDTELLRELFDRTIQASKILDIDAPFRTQVESALAKLPPLKIGKAGNLQEWYEDYADAAPEHRHISHLWALFPGNLIDRHKTPDLAKAAQNTLESRLAHGGGQTGWSRAWVVNYWAHLGNGEQAYDSMSVLFRQSTFPNLMDTHPPGVFQIDGNLGGANGMLESLVQSRWYPDHIELDLFPALPKLWTSGRITGLRIRGGQTLDLEWTPETATAKLSGSPTPITIKNPGQSPHFPISLPLSKP